MNKDSRIIIKNGLLFSVAPFIPKAVSIVLLPIMTKYLTDVDFGISGTIAAYTSALGAFSTLGLTVILLNSYFKVPDNYKETWRNLYGFLNLWMIIYALCQAVLLYFFIPEEALNNRWWIIILSNFSTVFFGPTAIIGNAYFVYSKQSVPVVWRSVMAGLITISVDFIFIVYLRMGYMGWYIGMFAGTFFSNASYWYVVNLKLDIKPKYKFNLQLIKSSLNISMPTVPHYYSNYLLEGSGRMVLDRFNVAQGEIGQISISQQIGDAVQTGIKGLSDALSPNMMQLINNGNHKRINQISYIFTSIVFLTCFLLALWSKEIFKILLSNESLQSSYPYFILYVMALCYRPLYLCISFFYFYHEKTKQLLLISFMSGIIALLFYLILTPFVGLWAFLIGHYIACLYFGYSGYFFSVYMKMSNIRLNILPIFLIQIGLTIISFYAVEYLAAKCIITISIIIASIIVTFNYRFLLNKYK